MEILIKVRSSEFYEGADFVLLDLIPDTIQDIAKALAAARSLAATYPCDPTFAFLEFWHCAPAWLEFGPSHLEDLGMEEDEFGTEMDNGSIIVPKGKTLIPVGGAVSVETVRLCVSIDTGVNKARFYWTGYDIRDNSKVSTYSMYEDDLRAWAMMMGVKLIGV